MTRPLIMLDLCSGLGGASQAMRGRGWQVVTVDNDPTNSPDILADVRTWTWSGPCPALVWASPPCTEFSRESMPWSRTGQKPSLELALSCLRIIALCQPLFWVVENVRGAIRHFTPILGPPRQSHGPFFLWGEFPRFVYHCPPFKEKLSSTRRKERAMVPDGLSLSLARAVESSLLTVAFMVEREAV